MCQIITLSGSKKDIISYMVENYNNLKESLNRKGGEGYSISAFVNDNLYYIIFSDKNDFDVVYKRFMKKFTIDDLNNYKDMHVILFSRQRPEMENNEVPMPPYFTSLFSKNQRFVWMHGTIQNVEELIKIYNLKNIKVDSEVFLANASLEELLKTIKGNYSLAVIELIRYSHDKAIYDLKIIDKGLGFYTFKEDNVFIATTDAFYKKDEIDEIKKIIGKSITDSLIVSYSGGMDITLSLIKVLKNQEKYNLIKYKSIDLIYFDYRARAREQELHALFKMEKYLKENFSNLNVTARVMNVEGMMQDISMIYNRDIKLINQDAQADMREAESTLAYIPFRNTLFAELMAIYAEGKGLTSADFLFGLNLSEGMLYLDNSEIWLTKINELIPRAGKEKYNYRVIAPFYNKTKINMLKEMYNELGEEEFNKILDISYSCYYPNEDGSPCGKCGSCILRQKAIEEIKKN